MHDHAFKDVSNKIRSLCHGLLLQERNSFHIWITIIQIISWFNIGLLFYFLKYLNMLLSFVFRQNQNNLEQHLRNLHLPKKIYFNLHPTSKSKYAPHI